MCNIPQVTSCSNLTFPHELYFGRNICELQYSRRLLPQSFDTSPILCPEARSRRNHRTRPHKQNIETKLQFVRLLFRILYASANSLHFFVLPLYLGHSAFVTA